MIEIPPVEVLGIDPIIGFVILDLGKIGLQNSQ
jgi:hypothetical protein